VPSHGKQGTFVSKLPWGLLLAFAGLGVVVTVVLALGPGSDHGAPWLAIASVVLAGWAMFLCERWLQNYVWGLVAALVLTLHPYFLRWANTGEVLLWAEALGLVVLAAIISSWRILFQKSFSPLAWIAIALIVTSSIGIAWILEPRMGLVTGILTLGALLLGSILAIRKHREASLCWGNISAAGFLAFLGPLGGLALAVVVMPHWHGFPRSTALPEICTVWDLMDAGFLPPADSRGDLSLMVTEMERWGWSAILTVAMMVVGWWRSLRRGWKCWRRNLPPLAWVLTMFVLVDLAGILLHPPRAAGIALLSFAPVAVLLNVFGVADLAQGLGERLVLSPPHER